MLFVPFSFKLNSRHLIGQRLFTLRSTSLTFYLLLPLAEAHHTLVCMVKHQLTFIFVSLAVYASPISTTQTPTNFRLDPLRASSLATQQAIGDIVAWTSRQIELSYHDMSFSMSQHFQQLRGNIIMRPLTLSWTARISHLNFSNRSSSTHPFFPP